MKNIAIVITGLLIMLISCNQPAKNEQHADNKFTDARADHEAVDSARIKFNAWKSSFCSGKLPHTFKLTCGGRRDTTVFLKKREKSCQERQMAEHDIFAYVCDELIHCVRDEVYYGKVPYYYDLHIEGELFDVLVYRVFNKPELCGWETILATYPKNGTRPISKIKVNVMDLSGYTLYSTLDKNMELDVVAVYDQTHSGDDSQEHTVRVVNTKYKITETGEIMIAGNAKDERRKFVDRSADGYFIYK